MEKSLMMSVIYLEPFYELLEIILFYFLTGWHILSKGNDYYSRKICSVGDTSTVIYFSKFAVGRGLQHSILLKTTKTKTKQQQKKPN